MATARIPTQTWTARAGSLYMASASLINFGTATSLSGAFASSGIAVESAVKNITITPPEMAWEMQSFNGVCSTGHQNQLLDEKPVGMATLTGSLILGENETIEDMISGVTYNITGGYARYQIGTSKTSNNFVSAVVTLINPGSITSQVSFGFDNARFSKWGDVKISGPDSHWEQDFTIICLPKDFYYEFKD